MHEIEIDLFVIIFPVVLSLIILLRLNNWKIKGLFSKKNLLLYFGVVIAAVLWVFIKERHF